MARPQRGGSGGLATDAHQACLASAARRMSLARQAILRGGREQTATMPIPFIDLQAQRKRLGQPLEDAILKVVRSGAYVMGPEIAEFEAALASFGEAPFA